MYQFPQFDLSGQVALVTASARGLGRAISLALAHAGADIALGLRDRNAHGGLPGEIEALGRRVLPLQMDVTHLDQIFGAVDGAVREFGRLDILVNNAGIAPENPAENVTEEDFDLSASSERLACSVGGSPTGGKVRNPVAWVAFVEETKRMKPTDKAILGMVSESPGRNASEPRSGLDKIKSEGRALYGRAKAAWHGAD